MAIRLRRGLDSDRLTVLLEQGEIAYTTDTKKLYIGDGVTLGGNGVSSSATSLITEGRNSTGDTLYKGTIIRIQGSTGALPNFVKAQGNNDANSAQTFGVIMNDIANNANGFVVTNGAIDTLDTRSTATHPFTDVTLADGDLLYLHPTIAGYVTNVKPYAPQHLVYVGVITRTSPTAGTIVYRIQNGYELDELHDVAAQTPSNNDGLFYESSTSLWKNKSISTVLGYTPIPLTGLSASSPLAYNNTTGAFSIQVANGSQNGYLSSTDWTTFNGKQNSSANLTSISALTFGSTSFVKMTASGTFALDTNTYLTAESDTLASVTGRGNTTTNAITVGAITTNGTSQGFIFQDQVGNTSNFAIYPKLTPSITNYILRCDGSNTIINAPVSAGVVQFRSGNTTIGQFHATTGNLTLQNGGTFTDAGFRLDVNGTARIQNQLTTTGSITAASAIARGVYMNNTLVASANNDILVGLDINPTFTNGAFTGVSNIALRVNGKIYSSTTILDVGRNNTLGVLYADNNETTLGNTSATAFTQFRVGGINMGRFHATTGNFTLQNGGTFTDAGYRLDVVGADSRFNGIRAGLGAGQVASNTVFGDSALGSNATGAGLTALGYRALRACTGSNNTAIGYQSLLANTIGANNTACGHASLQTNISGNSNCAFGISALDSNTTGSNNTAIGYSTSSGNFSGSTILGRLATATANNQFVVGSSTVNAGAVATAVGPVISEYWTVIINGVSKKIALIS